MAQIEFRSTATLWIVLVIVGAAALRAEASMPCRGVTPRTTADYTAAGSFPVGVKTVTFVDTSRSTPPNGTFPGAPARTLVTEIWYPALSATRDAPVDLAGAPYPIVVHSHGFLDSRTGESYLTQHLASRGFIVAAPDYPLSNGGAPGGPTLADVGNQPGDWSVVLDGVLAEFGTAADAGRVGASGLSLGGLTTLLVTFHRDLRDARIRAALPMAAPGCFFTDAFFDTTAAPLLLLHGDSDSLVPFRKNAGRNYRLAGAPKLMVRLRNGSHTGFSAFAVYFDQSQHFDAIGCTALGAFDLEMPPLGDEAVGIDPAPRCPLPCEEPVPAGPAMGAVRHHELARAVAAAFFDAYLRGDRSARCFLRRTARRENADLRVRSHGVFTAP